ncbi:MAG: UDP-N-acetylmuramyl-tripeptide synthetase [Candidatus Paceibacterota bacterium]|jgi:UDP-N-acetylmuramoyl-L-alanyl-D-glutamate--2,6-diaminopimelate ligase
MKSFLHKIIPSKVFSFYHYCLAWCAALRFGFPSKSIVVIGVTGTKGKTSAVNYVWSVLTAGGVKTGIITTANVRIGESEIMNPFHMTMPGRFKIQRFLRQMVSEKCEVAIVETTSQGIMQSRHIGIDYDLALFTNLSPEHIDAHKTFENYKQAKAILFKVLSESAHKNFRGKEFPKMIVANADSEHAAFFLNFPADKKTTYSIESESEHKAENITTSQAGAAFDLLGVHYELSIPGVFNVYNALPAIAIGEAFGISSDLMKKGVQEMRLIPGRMEEIKEGQNFRVFVDYAHEKQSMTYVVEAGKTLKAPEGRVIILLGAEGGGRDKGKRPIMGEIVGKHADIVICSNVDPYEDDPTPIVEDIAVAAEKEGKKRNENLFVIEDRREGIAKSLTIARPGDIVIITGKGAEQSITIGGHATPWDDRLVVREEIRKLKAN